MKTLVKILAAIVALGLLILAVPLWVYFIGYNFRIVEKNAFYGSRQMGGAALASYIKKYGIKTVINLRGTNAGSPWYDDEVAACQQAGVAHADFAWSKNKLPDPESLNKLINLIETGEKPFLAHCEGGTHRTAVAAAVYLLLKGADPATAREQFGPRFKNAPIGQLVTLYEGSGMPFKQWANEVYPGKYAALTASPEQPAAPQPTGALAPSPVK